MLSSAFIKFFFFSFKISIKARMCVAGKRMKRKVSKRGYLLNLTLNMRKFHSVKTGITFGPE